VKKPLKGASILVTRPAHQAENLACLIEQAGGIAIRFPCLKIIALEVDFQAANIVNQLSNAHWLIFTSPNAVNFALNANDGKISQFLTKRIAAIGKGTAKALENSGLRVDLVPGTGFDSEAMLALPEFQQVKGQNIVIVRGQGGRNELVNVLTQRGAVVGYLEVYRRVMPEIDNTPVLGLIERNELNGIVVTSGEALENLLKMIGNRYQERLIEISLVTISQRIQNLAASLGFKRIAVTENPSDAAMLDAVIAVTNGE